MNAPRPLNMWVRLYASALSNTNITAASTGSLLFPRLQQLGFQCRVRHALQGAKVGALERGAFKGAQQRSAVAAGFVVGDLLGAERGGRWRGDGWGGGADARGSVFSGTFKLTIKLTVSRRRPGWARVGPRWARSVGVAWGAVRLRWTIGTRWPIRTRGAIGAGRPISPWWPIRVRRPRRACRTVGLPWRRWRGAG